LDVAARPVDARAGRAIFRVWRKSQEQGRKMKESSPIQPDTVAYSQITAPENAASALRAMREFLVRHDESTFEHAVALYVASARHRQEPIEKVAGALSVLASDVEGPLFNAAEPVERSRMHALIFSGILRAFYGDIAVERGIGASAQRKADAPQHTKAGTWPSRHAD
jgi:hypothetical protein